MKWCISFRTNIFSRKLLWRQLNNIVRYTPKLFSARKQIKTNISVASYLANKVDNRNRKKCEICSKLSTRTTPLASFWLWNIFKVNSRSTRTTPLASFWCFQCELWTYFTPFSGVSIVDFEQVNVRWVECPTKVEHRTIRYAGV